mmetsp:Transcript_3767/g.5747  ORF Transcript_3767/g.5747 Transcript_3767/m.5747 type:complete len:134 (-) Transcript_3767:232-633(-)|eukprot:CAMPEP_0194200768 /NCGR_PEP_ID=MMETSP0156-20130528/1243_1 /TAXON_ID=33649 /ORGANISM="Thalassionema nitzschioides, Strain L26-B" /LENGTH=133 /DNA_ID=CAMNT_0038925815 /DNA_START=129 /DNA_END=530 /DNA_ORIENTATION=-
MISRFASRSAATQAVRMARSNLRATTRRNMGGGGGYLQLSPAHKMWGEAFGVVAWLWIFHRARNDLPVVLGYRHPWDHAEDAFAILEAKIHPDDLTDLRSAWEDFNLKAIKPGEDDDDDDDDDDEEDDDEDDE